VPASPPTKAIDGIPARHNSFTSMVWDVVKALRQLWYRGILVPRNLLHAISDCAAGADVRSLSDGHLNDVQIGHCGEELQPIGGGALDDVPMIQ
jgi:hypothetical protein